MPANRSRTERWRECLQQIQERGGGIEFSLARGTDEAQVGDLVWRVRILRLSDEEIIVERPSAAGQTIDLSGNVELVAVMSIGQNRWMFRTKTIGGDPRSRSGGNAVRLQMPTHVERCRRRDFLRVSTAELNLPIVTCWPLLDPMSVVAAEVANRAQIVELESGGMGTNSADILPEVAPPFTAQLMNLGGGGVGLLVHPGDSAALDRSRLLWVRADLKPYIPAPLGFTARVVHTHRDSEQNTYVGAAFDFGFHAAHREFVVSQIMRYVAALQGAQRHAA